MAAESVMAVEIWVLADGDGNYVCATDADDLKERYEEAVGELDPQTPTRVLKVSVFLPVPKAVQLTAHLPAEPDAATLAVA